jgi:branched-chain amino acid transport system permease protein
MPSTRGMDATIWALPVVLLVALALPSLDFTTVDVLLVLAVYVALGVSWNWCAGFGGLLNLAHVAYYAIGAYACALAVVVFGLHPAFGMLVGMAVSGLLAWATCSLTIRLKVADLYFALLTITLMEGLASICRGLENQYALGGFYLPFRNDPSTLQFLDKANYYYLLVGLSAALLAIQFLVMRSKLGLLILAARDSEPTASSVGVPVNRTLSALAVASSLPAALVGSIMALSSLHVTADAVFPFELLLSIIIAVVIGGIGTFWGPLVGAIIVTAIQELTRRLVGGTGIVGIADIIYGTMLVAIIIFVPDGLIGLYQRWRRQGR